MSFPHCRASRSFGALGLLMACCFTSLWDEPAVGQEPDSPSDKTAQTVVDPDGADADFLIQGEYVGGGQGLQVIARGDGEFEAVLLRGGLPGAGWDGRTRNRLQGTWRSGGEEVEVASPELVAVLDGKWASLETLARRPIARLAKVHRASPTLDLQPPDGATILFRGGTISGLKEARLAEDGLLGVGATTDFPVRDFRMHLEFRLPYMPHARGQGRGNSGVYIQRRYEVQILDSFGLDGEANECGALYRQRAPDLNMCFPPLAWQTFDISFRAAKWDALGNKIAAARITVLHNGVAVHQQYALAGKTGAGQAEGPIDLPIHFQDHGNPVRFRNIWLVAGTDLGAEPAGSQSPTESWRPGPAAARWVEWRSGADCVVEGCPAEGCRDKATFRARAARRCRLK